MKTQDYIKEFKNCLKDIDKDKKNEIIKEIESYINESEVNYSSLVERFGTPEELAKGYLEDIPVKEQKNNTFLVQTKRVVITIASFIFIVLAIIAFIIYKYTQDPFDYSKYTAVTINEEINSFWTNIDNIDHIKVEQAQVVFYWSENDKFEYSCEGNTVVKEENTFTIKQSRCYVKVPKKAISIKTYQSQIVLVKPGSNINIDTEQTSLRIAEKNENYQYQFDPKQSDINNLTSKENGITINGKFFQSDISAYKY